MKFFDNMFRIDPEQLHSNSQTSYRILVAGRLWAGTFIVMAICSVAKIPLQAELWLAWLTALVAMSGLDVVQFSRQRSTDYGALDRQATIEAAKVGPSAEK